MDHVPICCRLTINPDGTVPAILVMMLLYTRTTEKVSTRMSIMVRICSAGGLVNRSDMLEATLCPALPRRAFGCFPWPLEFHRSGDRWRLALNLSLFFGF